MKLYVVFGVEFHIGRELLGIYDSKILAIERQNKKKKSYYDDVVIDEIELDKDIDPE